MKRPALHVILAALCLASIGATTSAQAQLFVANNGSDTTTCGPYYAPCVSFQGAITRMTGDGTIVCLTGGQFGLIRPFYSLTVSCDDVGATATYLTTDVLQPGKTVIVSGVSFVKSATTETAGSGSSLRAAAVLITRAVNVKLANCTVAGDDDASAPTSGVWVNIKNFQADLSISNCQISGYGGAPGILLMTSGAGSAKVTISNSSSSNNNVGLRADTTLTSGKIDLTVVDSVLDGNTYQGLVVEGGVGQVTALASRVSASNNGTQGMRSVNATATLRISDSDISGNAMGIEAVNGGIIQSFGNNRMIGNTNSSVLPPIVSQR